MNTNYRDELDEMSRKKLETLLQPPRRNATTAAHQRAIYLAQVRNMPVKQPVTGLVPWLSSVFSPKDSPKERTTGARPLGMPSARILVAALEIMLIVISTSFFTVFAAQDSIPTDPIYPVKLLAEDVRMSLTSQEVAKVELALELAETRMEEIVALQEQGVPVEEPVITRMEEHYQVALQVAAEMPDTQMSVVLQEVQDTSHVQLQTMTTLAAAAPEKSEDQFIYTKRMLQRNENLAKNGIKYPAGFRNAMGNKGGPGAGSNTEPVEPAVEIETVPIQPENRPPDAGNSNGRRP